MRPFLTPLLLLGLLAPQAAFLTPRAGSLQPSLRLRSPFARPLAAPASVSFRPFAVSAVPSAAATPPADASVAHRRWPLSLQVLRSLVVWFRNRGPRAKALMAGVAALLYPLPAMAALYQRKYRGPAWGNYAGYAAGGVVVVGAVTWAYMAEINEQKRIKGAYKRVKKLENEFMNVEGESQTDDDLASELRDRLKGKKKEGKDGKDPPPPPEGREGRKRSSDPKRPPPSAPSTMTGGGAGPSAAKPSGGAKRSGGAKPSSGAKPSGPEDVDRLKKMWESPGGDYSPPKPKGGKDDDDDLL